MIAFSIRTLLVFSVILMWVPMANAEALKGSIGSSEQAGSSWLNLTKITDFEKGDRLQFKVGGTAKKIVVRFLSQTANPNTPSGIDGDVIEIPKNRMLEITLEEDHYDVMQISVHGGTNPWGTFFLGLGNGSATILFVQGLE